MEKHNTPFCIWANWYASAAWKGAQIDKALWDTFVTVYTNGNGMKDTIPPFPGKAPQSKRILNANYISSE